MSATNDKMYIMNFKVMSELSCGTCNRIGLPVKFLEWLYDSLNGTTSILDENKTAELNSGTCRCWPVCGSENFSHDHDFLTIRDRYTIFAIQTQLIRRCPSVVVEWFSHLFISPQKPLDRIWRNLTGINYSIKLVFFWLIGKQRWPLRHFLLFLLQPL